MKKDNKITIEFIVLMSVFMALVALVIDGMLPALTQIGNDLQVKNQNDIQFIVLSAFLGITIGLLFFGPLSDSFGRKNSIYIGMLLFLIGCFLSIIATTMTSMLIGRVLQGIGVAACRVVSVAIVRDCFEGKLMAKVVSLIMVFFMFFPALTPFIGQVVLLFASWRILFLVFMLLGVITTIYFALRQEETLLPENRLSFSFITIKQGAIETCSHTKSIIYTIVIGFVFGGFVAYLSLAPQLLQEQYKLGDKFSLVFGGLAVSMGVSFFANAKWLDKHSMETLCKRALIGMVLASVVFLPFCFLQQGHPALIFLVCYLVCTFFAISILTGNLNALALEPLGHIAGLANSIISSLQTLLSLITGGIISYLYDGTVFSLVGGFLLLSVISFILMIWEPKKSRIYTNTT